MGGKCARRSVEGGSDEEGEKEIGCEGDNSVD